MKNDTHPGTVWLVGAGPGDAGLLTLRGWNALQQADTIVYDHLLGNGILSLFPPAARKIYVGKQAGNHPMPQEKINQILLQEANEGRQVVRMKGGDPFLFGRGGEELQALQAAGIPCIVVPGVSSAFAAPAYAGIPVTQRGLSRGVHIFTGHPAAGGTLSLPFSTLAKLPGTLVFLMGVSTAPALCSGLLAAGMPADTPAAAVEHGTWACQRTVTATLSTLPQRLQQAAIHPPAALVIGPTVPLAESLHWTDSLPLFGKRIVVTRPRQRCTVFCQQITALGGEVLLYPCIRTSAAPTDTIDAAVRSLQRYSWISFSSAAGVRTFWQALQRAGKDCRALAGIRIAAVGPSTAACLQQHGLQPDLLPAVFDSAHLGEALCRITDTNDHILLLRAENGSRAQEESLTQAGIPFTACAAYRTVPETESIAEPLRREIAAGRFDLLTFFSASAVQTFFKAFPQLPTHPQTICIGAETADAARAHGLQPITAPHATAQGMLESILHLPEIRPSKQEE